MAVFYRGPELVITHEVLVVLGPPRQKLKLDELSDARVLRGQPHPARTLTRHSVTGALLVAATTWQHLDRPSAWLAMTVLVAGTVGAHEACRHLCPRPWELWAQYRGLDVRLYHCTDPVRFGQISRALGRALARAQRFGGY
jgi:hypothetical protein